MNSETAAQGSRLWQWYLIIGLTTTAGYFLLPRGGLAQALVFVAVHLSALVALVVGVRVHRPSNPSVWYVIIAGETLYATANLIWYPYPVAFDRVLPYPSLADAVYLLGYGAILVGLALLVQARTAGRDRVGLTDTAIVTVGLGVLSWLFFMEPVLEDSSMTGLAQLTSIAYPLIDILFLAILMRLVFSPGARLPAYLFIALGVVAQLGADTWYARSSLQGTFSFGTWFFSGWLVFYVFLGTAALHPSMRQLSEPTLGHQPVLTIRRLAFLAAAALVSPAVLALHSADRNDEYVLAASSAVLFLLVLGRMRGLVAEITEHERMKRLQDEFTSMVSHELRTPLTSIRGALGLVAGGALGPIPEKAQRMLDIANDNTGRLVRLINDILDIERMESGRITLEKRPCRADHLVRRAADAMRAMAESSGVLLRTDGDNAQVSVDEDRMMQTVTNLLSNAIKFSPRGGTVRLAARRRADDVVFTVEDEGRGIPPEHIETIFAPFHQVDSSDSRDKGGTGLGLAICRSIVDQHGGRLWAESTPGQGAKFSFTVPALEETEAVELLLPSGPQKPMLVLLVEDDLDLAQVLTTVLERKGVEVLHAPDGGEAIRISETVVPDLVVLDLLLPEVDGFAVVEWMRHHDRLRLAPLVVYTVAQLDDVDRERLRLGHTEFLNKGCVSPKDFDERVGELLARLAGQRDMAGDAA